jgi:starch phosphorylase
MPEAMKDIATPAPTQQNIEFFRTDFELTRKLPEPLKALEVISRNFYWSWQPEGIALFRDLDPVLWDRYSQNPRLLLRRLPGLRLWQKAADSSYTKRLDAFYEQFKGYLSDETELFPLSPVRSIVYFCAEYGVHNSLPNYSGGLGILAGDHLKSASDLNLPLTAVGLLYRFGYFHQQIGHDGWQKETYSDVFQSEAAVSPVLDPEGNRMMVSVHIRQREVFAQAWLAEIGRIKLYLLDTNVPENGEVDRFITGHLYGGDTETRIVQEKVLGIGGVRLLRKLGVDPDVYHLNEGHAAFSTLELAREFLIANPDKEFSEAMEFVRSRCVFTTHTPVAAGNDLFFPGVLIKCFSREYIDSLKLSDDGFLDLGRCDINNDEEYFGMTPLALRMCRSSNGVSKKHGEVTRELWLRIFPDLADPEAVPITHVTNGVHAPTWIAPLLQDLYREQVGPNWHEMVRDQGEWGDAVGKISKEEIWARHCSLKSLMIAFIRERTRAKDTGDIDTIHEHEHTKGLFSPDVLTIGFARRVAAYKRWDLLLTDLPRLLRLVDDEERPVQFIFAGKAHPQDNTAKKILQELMQINHDSHWQRRAVFIEDYDQEVARYLVQGVDVWMNVPRRPMEASGTSGMKAAMNGVLNCSILDGWWPEASNGYNGFPIGNIEEFASDAEADAAEAEALYRILEKDIVPVFYKRDENGIPVEWVDRMKNAMATITSQFSSDRMVSDYLSKIYTTPSS